MAKLVGRVLHDALPVSFTGDVLGHEVGVVAELIGSRLSFSGIHVGQRDRGFLVDEGLGVAGANYKKPRVNPQNLELNIKIDQSHCEGSNDYKQDEHWELSPRGD